VYSFLDSYAMALADVHPHVVSVTEAVTRGVSGLVKDVEQGEDVVVARRGHPVAAVVSMRRLEQLRSLESDLRDIALVLTARRDRHRRACRARRGDHRVWI